MIHKITEEQLLSIEQTAGIVTPAKMRLSKRIDKIVSDLGLIRQKSNLATNADVPPIIQGNWFFYNIKKIAAKIRGC